MLSPAHRGKTLACLLVAGLLVAALVAPRPARAEEVPAAPPSAPAVAPAPTGPTVNLADYEAIVMLTATEDVRKAPAERRQAAVAEHWEKLPEATKGLLGRQMAWAREHLSEGGRAPWTTARGMAFFVAGPPSRIHTEATRAWSGDSVMRLDAQDDVVAALARGGEAVATKEAAASGGAAPRRFAPPADPTASPLALSGDFPTEVWVYSTALPGTLRALTFVDEDGDGTLRLVKDDLVDAAAALSSAPGVELPPDLQAQASAGRVFQPLPVLTQNVLAPKVETAAFKAHAAKTHVRFYFGLAPEDVDLELGVPAAAYLAGATVRVRIEQGGEAVEQLEVVAATTPLTEIDGLLVADLGAPLLPGEYTYTAQVSDAAGKGGQVSGRLSVPALGGSLSLSTPLLAKADGTGDAASLPKAAASTTGVLSAFQLGSYIVKPQLSRTFRRGDTLAVVVQAYSAPSAVLEFDLEYEGTYQASLEDSKVSSLPHTEIQLVPVVAEWPDGSYAFVITATDPAAKDRKVVVRVPFKVKG